jgi:hypothetical protein
MSSPAQLNASLTTEAQIPPQPTPVRVAQVWGHVPRLSEPWWETGDGQVFEVD